MTKRIRTADVQIDLRGLLEAYERKLIIDALVACGGHQKRAAASLGVLPTTFHEKMKRLGIVVRRGDTVWIGPARADEDRTSDRISA
jgi:DNA-binding NtrC family response regulator